MTVEIREVNGEELLTTAFPLTVYAFGASPHPSGAPDDWRRWLPYHGARRTFVLLEDGEAVATASAIAMTQNVRGVVLPMGGVAGVATHPAARRKGHVRGLLTGLVADMRSWGWAVSTLYPFRSSFYQRFGYALFPKAVTARFSPDDLAGLPETDPPAEITLLRGKEALAAYLDFVTIRQPEVHGFALAPDATEGHFIDKDDHWVALAKVGGTPVGVMEYHITKHAGELVAERFIYAGAVGRLALLQWVARHVDQVSTVQLSLPPGSQPELWLTDLSVTTESRTAVPHWNPPMGRVLSVEGLAGIEAGPGELVLELVDDVLPAASGRYALAGEGGRLAVQRLPADGAADVTVSAVGLAALVYGVADPDEVALRGWGTVPAVVRPVLGSLFDRRIPFVHEDF